MINQNHDFFKHHPLLIQINLGHLTQSMHIYTQTKFMIYHKECYRNLLYLSKQYSIPHLRKIYT